MSIKQQKEYTMRRFIPFCILLFSLTVTSVLAETFPGSEMFDIKAALESLDKLIPEKDEFETTEVYRKKVRSLIKTSPFLSGDPEHTYCAELAEVSFLYNADEQKGSYLIALKENTDYLTKDKLRFYLEIDTEILQSEKYIASNALGVEREVTDAKVKETVLILNAASKDLSRWNIEQKMPSETARRVKEFVKAVVQFQIDFEILDNDKPGLYSCSDFHKPTISDPYALWIYRQGLVAKNVKITLFDSETREIFHTIDCDTYKSLDTLEREAEEMKERLEEEARRQREQEAEAARLEQERKAEEARLRQEREAEEARLQLEKEKREAEERRLRQEEKEEKIRQKKAELRKTEFYQEWETPNGVVFAKYVKLRKGNVILQKPKGQVIEVPLDSFSPQQKDLLKVAQAFLKMKKELKKTRTWLLDTQIKTSRGTKIISKRTKGRIVSIENGKYGTSDVLVLDVGKDEMRRIHLNELSADDIQWLKDVQKDFTQLDNEYKAQYGISPFEMDSSSTGFEGV